MSTSGKLLALAEALAEDLSDATFSQEFDAACVPFIRHELPDVAELTVSVMPVAERIGNATRTASGHEYDVLVAIQQQVAEPTTDSIAPLTKLVDEIADRYYGGAFDDPVAHWLETDVVPYVPGKLVNEQQFAAFLRFTFYGER